MSSPKDFSGKVVLITVPLVPIRSSSGIGEGIATYLSSLGAQVVITGRNEQRVKTVAEKCRQLSQQKVLEVVADITKDEDIKQLLHRTIEEFGKLDVLVNNAGIIKLVTVSDQNIMNDYETIMNTNVRTVLLLTILSVPYLEKTKGNIINVSSISGLKPFPSIMVNCMAKSALDMLTKCLALELGPKAIRVNSINPAAIRTPIFEKFGLENFNTEVVEKSCASDYPLGRIGEPIDCAKAVAYLASDDAAFISGITLPVDGAFLNANITTM